MEVTGILGVGFLLVMWALDLILGTILAQQALSC